MAKSRGVLVSKNELLEARIENLPGGYQMRVKLSAMLLGEPNFLLLDEPTNYLDLNTLILLENFLQDYNGGFIIISHDREFLRNTSEHTLEVELGELALFPGKVEEYLQYKTEQKELKIKQNQTIEAKRKELQNFVDRFRAKASKATQAQSKLKQLGKLKTLEINDAPAGVRINIPAVETRKGVALRTGDLKIGYPDKIVAENVNIEIGRGDRVAILGDNGQGKSTLLRTLTGHLPALDGEFKWSQGLNIAYYAQNVYATLDADMDVITHLENSASKDVSRQECLNMAGSFLFSGDEIRKPIGVLSGGERARLVLAGLLLSKSQVLALDEPTNHLDFETVEALGFALRDYKGTLLFVSHDRTFVNLVANRIVEVRDGNIALYPGVYEDYVYSIRRRIEEEAEKDSGKASSPGSAKKKSKGEEPGVSPEAREKNSYQLRKEWQSRLGKARKALSRAEEEMAALEKEKEEILAYFAENPGVYSPDHNTRLEELEKVQGETEARWLELQEEIENLESQIARAQAPTGST